MLVEKIKKNIKDLGVKPNYEIWEIFLTRKLNFILGVAFFNLFVFQILFYCVLHINYLSNFILLGQLILVLVFFSNIRFHYLCGVYGFFFIGISLVSYLSLLLGQESNTHLYYFPIILNIVQLLNRKTLRVHMYIILSEFIIAMSIITYCYSNKLFSIPIEPNSLSSIKVFNIIMSSIVTLIFTLMISFQNKKQEEKIQEMLLEKDVLLAEIFHRVKNNMNIITSLLNLKKNNSNSKETQDALEECRNRVFSMALVHQKIFNSKNISELKFDEYSRDLIKEIGKSLGEKNNDIIEVNTVIMELSLNQAIPCGLILNELITNSYKHARMPDRKLKILVDIRKAANKNQIIVSDNGPGIPGNSVEKTGSLGLELIKSLSNQIDGDYKFENENGLKFILTF